MQSKIVTKKEQDILEHEFEVALSTGHKPKSTLIQCAYCGSKYRLGSRHYKSDWCIVKETQNDMYSKNMSPISKTYLKLIKAIGIHYEVVPMSDTVLDFSRTKYKQVRGTSAMWVYKSDHCLFDRTEYIPHKKRVAFIQKCLESKHLLGYVLALNRFRAYKILKKALYGLGESHINQMSCDELEAKIKVCHSIYFLERMPCQE